MIKPTVQTESFNRLIKVISSQSQAITKFSQDDVTEILAVYPQVSLTSCEVSSGRVNYGGRIVNSIVYINEEGKLCRMQKGADFTYYADDDILAPAQNALCKTDIEKTQIKRDGSSFIITNIIGAEIAVYAQTERLFVTDIDGAIVNKGNCEFYSAVTFSGEGEVEDDFDADCLADILIPSAQIVVMSCRCSAAEVEVEGEIYLSLFAMRGDMPVCLERVIPFKNAVVCDYASTGIYADVNVEIKNLNVNATVNEDKGKCGVNFVCELAFYGVFFTSEEQAIVTDAFDVGKQLKITYGEESAYLSGEITYISERVSGMAACKAKLDYTCQLRAAAQPYAECSYVTESGALEGGVCALLVYEQGGEIKSTTFTLPFAIPLDATEQNSLLSYTIAVCGINIKQPTEGELEVEAVLKIAYSKREKVTAKYIEAVDEGEDIAAKNSCVSVCFPTRGDSLWDVAKKLHCSPEEVEENNKGLTFPLNGDERVFIYRGKN